jgi:hypothetical protein
MRDLVSLAESALQSSKQLYDTIKSSQSGKRTITELKHELEDLVVVLASVKEVVNNSDPIFNSLRTLLYYCGNACLEFEKLLRECTSNLTENRTSLRDWIKLRYKGEDINSFRVRLAIYKATINIAIGDINL